MLEEARNAGSEVVKLESTITAKPFYQRLGFRDRGEQILTEINGVGIRSYPMELNLRSNFEDIVALEKRLLEPSVRTDLKELDRLLDDSFVEFGSSGRRYGKSDILDLLARDNSSVIEAYDFEPIALADDVVQLRFKTRRKLDGCETTLSLRSSIWRKSPRGWRMIFHQGTPTEF